MQRMGNLLDVPIHRLMDELSASTAARLDRVYVVHLICVVDHAFSHPLFLQISIPLTYILTNALAHSEPHPNIPQRESSETEDDTLWVDRYRPHRFTDLLGNERVAREIMAWVKGWDFCVFGKKARTTGAREGGGGYKNKNNNRGGAGGGGGKRPREEAGNGNAEGVEGPREGWGV